MSTRPYFFQRINDIYLLTKYQNIKSKLPKLKMEHQEGLKKNVYKMIMNQNEKDVIECDHEIVMKIGKSPQSQKKMDIIFHYQYPLDKNDGYSIICKQAEFPNINVSVRRQTLSKEDSSKIHLQLYLCQFCQSQKKDSSFYRIIFGGLSGKTHFLIGQEEIFSFQKIKILKSSKGKSPLHIMMALYQQNGNQRTWLDFYTSQPLFVTEDASILLLNNKESIIKYIEQFEIENVSSPSKFHIYSNYNQQIVALENHLTNLSPKILNLFYLAYKFSQICEIYFQRDPITIPQIQQFNKVSKKWPQISPKKLSWFQRIVNFLIEVKAKIQQNESQGDDAKLVCNHLNPKSNIVFRIINPLHKVRFILAEQFTNHICIVNGIEYDLSSFRKLQTSDIKNVYKIYLDTTKKAQKNKILKAKGKSNQFGTGIQSDSKQNNNIQDESQDLNDESKHKTPVKIHKTRASSKKKVQKNENHYSLQKKPFHQIEVPLKPFQQKRVYQTDMKKITQLSKKEKLEVKKREKQQTKDIYQTFVQKASNFQQNSIKSQKQNKQTKFIQNKKFSFYKAYQITYCFNEHNSTTTFNLDNSLFIDNKSNNRRYRQPLPTYIYDFPQYIPYPHEIRYIKPRYAEREASFDNHSSYTQGEPPLFFNRAYPRGYFYESPPRRYKNHGFHPYQQQFQKDDEEQQSGKKSYFRLHYERQKSKHSK